MSKSILVIDTPEDCIGCPCHFLDNYGMIYCRKNNKILLPNDIENVKPTWCPLKEIPKKKKPRKIQDNNLGHFHISAFDKGYNKCIEEILQ